MYKVICVLIARHAESLGSPYMRYYMQELKRGLRNHGYNGVQQRTECIRKRSLMVKSWSWCNHCDKSVATTT